MKKVERKKNLNLYCAENQAKAYYNSTYKCGHRYNSIDKQVILLKASLYKLL